MGISTGSVTSLLESDSTTLQQTHDHLRRQTKFQSPWHLLPPWAKIPQLIVAGSLKRASKCAGHTRKKRVGRDSVAQQQTLHKQQAGNK